MATVVFVNRALQGERDLVERLSGSLGPNSRGTAFHLRRLQRLDAWIVDMAPALDEALEEFTKQLAARGLVYPIRDRSLQAIATPQRDAGRRRRRRDGSGTGAGGGAFTAEAATAARGPIEPYHVAMVGASEPGDGGAGVRVALIDTGLFSDDIVHPDLASGARTVERVSLVGARNDPNDSSGHGTRMAGLIAGASPVCASGSTRGAPAGRYGIAPNASLLSIRIGDADPDVALAVEALDLALRGECAVINISFGFARIDDDGRAGFQAAVERCVAQGAVVLASAGNRGEMAFPASCPGVLAIGAVNRMARPLANSPKPDADGRGVDLVAPGELLITSRLRQAPASSACSHDTVSFTSPACAVASGVAALYASNHELRGAHLRQKLIDTARALPLAGRDASKVGHGLVRYQSPDHA